MDGLMDLYIYDMVLQRFSSKVLLIIKWMGWGRGTKMVNKNNMGQFWLWE